MGRAARARQARQAAAHTLVGWPPDLVEALTRPIDAGPGHLEPITLHVRSRVATFDAALERARAQMALVCQSYPVVTREGKFGFEEEALPSIGAGDIEVRSVRLVGWSTPFICRLITAARIEGQRFGAIVAANGGLPMARPPLEVVSG